MLVLGTGVLEAGGCATPRQPLRALPRASSDEPAAGPLVTVLFGCQLPEVIHSYRCCAKMLQKEQRPS